MEWRKFRHRLALLHPSRRAWPPSQCLALRHFCFRFFFCQLIFSPLSLSPAGGVKISLAFISELCVLFCQHKQIRSTSAKIMLRKRGLFELAARTRNVESANFVAPRPPRGSSFRGSIFLPFVATEKKKNRKALPSTPATSMKGFLAT